MNPNRSTSLTSFILFLPVGPTVAPYSLFRGVLLRSCVASRTMRRACGTGGRRFTSLTGRRGHRGSYEMEAGVKRPFHPHGGSGERNEARGLESFILVTVGWVCMVPSVLLEVITSSSDSFSHRCHRITFIFPSFPHYICWSTRFTS